jgi:MYXO-CTERM domain-containing protein
MRFFQRDDDFECPTANASLQSGGWQGGGAAPCGGGFDAGELLVSFAPDNPETILGWIDNTANYSGPLPPRDLDFEVRGSGTTPLGGSLETALDYMSTVQGNDASSACRPYRVVLLTDGLETCDGAPETAAAALLAADMPVYVIGFATTDTAITTQLDAIAAAGGTTEAIFVDDDVELAAAMASIVEETIRFELCNGEDDDCDGAIDEDFPDLGDACNDGEGTGICYDEGVMVCSGDEESTVCDADDDPVCNQTNCPEQCNGLDDDCDILVDEGLAGCDCVGQPEVCNGADDDCDGDIDEEVLPVPAPECGFDVGECEPGTLNCVAGDIICEGETGPAPEVCNGLDDDCDNQTDEIFEACYDPADGGCDLGGGTCLGFCQIGVRTCDGNQMGTCENDVHPGVEICNGEDDDCDGVADDGFPGLGDDCTIGQGVCQTQGQIVCTDNGQGTECNAVVVSPGEEVCNGLDDDCDGDTDEELGAPIGEPCGGGQGCDGGVFECIDGEVSCEGGNNGEPEVCNNMDDDCDFAIDEDTSTNADCVAPEYQTPCDPDCTGTQICIDGQCSAGDEGECEFGDLVCIFPGSAQDPPEQTCVGYQGPLDTELCNGLDDDCDGDTDDMAECPSPDDLCVDAACVFPCLADEFPCPYGFYCDSLPEGDFCLPDPCIQNGVECPDGEFCQVNDETGDSECVDLCAGVECLPGAMCQGGLCVDCFDTGCEDGFDCIRNGDGVGVCIEDQCDQVTCDEGQFCDPDNGECVTAVCDPSCSGDEICVDGECVSDPCSGADCSSGQICNPGTGECVSNECSGVDCAIGDACVPETGECADDPCEGAGRLECPVGTECEIEFDGSATCVDVDGEFVFAGGSGCGCQAADGSGQGAWLLLLGAVALVRRRRRKKN